MSTDCTTLDRLRGPKILDMSIFDWVTSLAAATLVGWLFGITGGAHWVLFILAWILFGVVTHYAFGVKTMLGYYLGLNTKPLRNKHC
uniref:Uncharacterized protein n=1 Tax=viral metagenome TaxID=1070528 RepID=A0A6C0DTR2_9ZZZZ